MLPAILICIIILIVIHLLAILAYWKNHQFDFLHRILYNIFMIKTLPVTKAREELTSLVENAAKRLDEYVITVNGVPKAVLMSSDEFDSWQETMDILSDPKALREIKESEKQIARGEYVTLEQLKKELDLDV